MTALSDILYIVTIEKKFPYWVFINKNDAEFMLKSLEISAKKLNNEIKYVLLTYQKKD